MSLKAAYWYHFCGLLHLWTLITFVSEPFVFWVEELLGEMELKLSEK